MKKISRITESDISRIIKKVINENVSSRADELYSHINELIDYEYKDVELEEIVDVLENILENTKAKSYRKNKKIGSITRDMVRKNWGLNEEKTESFWFDIKKKLKGISDKQLKYNMDNDLPWDWKGSKEGFYEKMEPRSQSKRSD